MSRVLICGLCPLPFENTLQNYGPGIRTWQFSAGLAQAGHEVHLVALQIHSAYDQPPEIRENYEGVQILRLTSEEFFGATAVAEAYERIVPDAVVGATVYGSFVLARLRPDVPFWADQFGDFMAEAQAKAWLEGANWPVAHFWRFLQPVLRAADKMSVVSSIQRGAAIGELATAGRLTAETCGYEFVSVMPCPLLPSRPVETRPMLRPDKIPADAFVVLWSGGYNVWSDVDTIFAALEQAMEADPRIHFVSTGGAIAGHNDRTYDTFQQQIVGSKHAARFHLLGWIAADDVPSVEAESDLGILADVPMYEGQFGSKNRIVQWMGRKLPIVYNRIGDIGELLVERQLGLSFELGDSEALGHLITWAAGHPAELAAMADRAYDYTCKELSIEATCTDLVAWAEQPHPSPDAEYRELIGGPSDFAPAEATSEVHDEGEDPRFTDLQAEVRRLQASLTDIHNSKMWRLWMSYLAVRRGLAQWFGRGSSS